MCFKIQRYYWHLNVCIMLQYHCEKLTVKWGASLLARQLLWLVLEIAIPIGLSVLILRQCESDVTTAYNTYRCLNSLCISVCFVLHRVRSLHPPHSTNIRVENFFNFQGGIHRFAITFVHCWAYCVAEVCAHWLARGWPKFLSTV